jgi:hypothetical protein
MEETEEQAPIPPHRWHVAIVKHHNGDVEVAGHFDHGVVNLTFYPSALANLNKTLTEIFGAYGLSEVMKWAHAAETESERDEPPNPPQDETPRETVRDV